MTEFHFIIILLGCIFFMTMCFAKEIKQYIKDKEELNDAMLKAFERHKTNIDVK